MALTKESAKSQTDVVQLISPEATREVQMGINVNGIGHIIERLTSLYTDPIAATVREVVSNAIDATVLVPEAARRPVQISTPSPFQTSFVVEDFGVGMSMEIIEKIYSQYGASTKTSDFRQIGAYGLGAKAPLAYCNEFTVETTRDGITTVFAVARKTDGNFINILSSEETGKPNGTKVSVPARHADTSKFQAALKTYKTVSFDVPVEIDGQKFDSSAYLVLNDSFVLDEESDTRGRIWIKKENITDLFLNKLSGQGYGLTHSYQLSGWTYTTGSHYHRDASTPIVVELKPGVVDFSSSRDEIMRNDRYTNLNDRVQKFTADASDEALEQIIAIYRTFSDEDAFKFFARLIRSAVLDEKTGDVTIRNRNYNAARSAYTLDADMFKTAKGYSPYVDFVLGGRNHKLNIVSGFTVTGGEGSYIGSESTWINADYYRSSRVTQMNAKIMEEVVANKPQLSLFNLVVNNEIRMAAGPTGRDKVIVVESPTEKEAKSILNARKLLSENGYHRNMILFTVPESLDAQILWLANRFPEFKVTKKTPADFVEEIKKIRKENRATPVTPDEDFSVRVLVEGNDVTSEAAIADKHCGKYVKLTVDQLKKEKAVLVLCHGRYRSALVGAANAGISITGRPVYVVLDSNGLYAKHYKQLLDYDRVVVAVDFKARSAAARALAEKKTYSGNILDSEIREMTDDDTIYAYFSGTAASSEYLKFFGDWLKKNHPNSPLMPFFKLYEKGSSSRIRVQPTEAQIVDRFKNGDKLVKFSTHLAHFGGYSFSDQTFARMLNVYTVNDKDRPMMEMLTGMLYEMLDFSSANEN